MTKYNGQGIIELNGLFSGPTSIVMVGVHGNEVCGLNAIKEIIPEIEIISGKVFFIVGNPNAVAQNVRFAEFNLNRAFKNDSMISESEKKSYEYCRAQFLKFYLNQAGALLDIHSSATPNSIPFVICEENAISIVQKFPVKIVASGFDRVNPGGTDEYMNRTGKIGICIECGEHTDPQARNIAKQAIYSFLDSREHINSPVINEQMSQQRILVESIYYSTAETFNIAKAWGDFEKVPKGAVIGTDGNKEILAEVDSIILFARNRNGIGQEAFYLGREIIKLGSYGDWPKDGH